VSSLLGRRNYSARSFDIKDFVLKISLALIGEQNLGPEGG